MEHCEVKIRDEFFISSLFIEESITKYLSEKLNIEDVVNSNALGYTDNALSFNQKMELMIESGGYSIIDKSKLSVFKSIRNEFLINNDVCNLEGCFTSSDSNDDFLLILYPQSDYLPREEKLINACYQLIGEVSELVSNATDKTEVKIRRKNFFAANANKLGKLTFLFSFLFIR